MNTPFSSISGELIFSKSDYIGSMIFMQRYITTPSRTLSVKSGPSKVRSTIENMRQSSMNIISREISTEGAEDLVSTKLKIE
jgi:hypothetical protein